MDDRQLLYFRTIAEEESFTKAAAKLSVSQSTLSMSMKKLEEEAGAKLFFSMNRRQQLTDAGKAFLEGSTRVREAYDEMMDRVRRSGSAASGTVTLGLSPLFGSCFFGDLIPSFYEAYPHIQINMIEDGANRIDEKVRDGALDLAVTLKTERAAAFETCHFSTQRNVALLYRDHPLAKRRSLTVADLKDEPFAIFNEDFILNRQILSACRQAGFWPKIVLLSSQWDFMVEMVSRNRAVSILPKPVLDKHPDPNVRCVPLTDSMKYWDIILAWNRGKYMSAPCRIFLNYIRENLPQDDL